MVCNEITCREKITLLNFVQFVDIAFLILFTFFASIPAMYPCVSCQCNDSCSECEDCCEDVLLICDICNERCNKISDSTLPCQCNDKCCK